ncbi:LytTr DNA-binding domain-containing protein [Mucilaginibacter polytrichastri]|nr:LytTr DNA-binding domain-containing protein [Mucilaginibacter polytrichastri]
MRTEEGKIITAMNLKTIHDQLPKSPFIRVSKSYVINVHRITAIDNDFVTIREVEVPIGDISENLFLTNM